MILYLDASALVKRYIEEKGSSEVKEVLAKAKVVGTSIISRAEVPAALAKAIRTETLTREEAEEALGLFCSEWQDFVRIQATDYLLVRAGELAWRHSLRGYDSVHLASALIWKEGMNEEITVATFDQKFWKAVGDINGLIPFPDDLTKMLIEWQKHQT